VKAASIVRHTQPQIQNRSAAISCTLYWLERASWRQKSPER